MESNTKSSVRTLTYKGKVSIVEALSVFLTYLHFVSNVTLSEKGNSVTFDIKNLDSKRTTVGRIAYTDKVWQLVPSYLAGLALVFSKLDLTASFFSGDKVKDWHKVRSLSASSGIDQIMVDRHGAERSHQSLAVKYLLGDLFRGGSELSSKVKSQVGDLDF